jgi:inosine/xanthosine triphosphate pyrophosphatase family protein
MRGDVRVATGNAAKLRLLMPPLEAAGLRPLPVDPGDAEDRAPVGYESAVRAKIVGVRDLDPGSTAPIVAHDSGFEFECLDWLPGPSTRAWLSSARAAPGGVAALLTPHSRVRVVHCVAVSTEHGLTVFREHDDRVVAETLRLHDSDLPLTDCFEGPVEALTRVMESAVERIVGEERAMT